MRGIAALCLLLALTCSAPAHLKHRPDLTEWLRTLYSQRSPCCDSTEAETMADPDWRIAEDKNECLPSERWALAAAESFHVCARLQDQNGEYKWWQVPVSAIVQTGNKAGPALIWMYWAASGKPFIRCFLPGTLT